MNNRLEKLNQKIETLENRLEPLMEERRKLWQKQSDEIRAKIERAEQLEDKFQLDELLFAATSKCQCGAGLAYPKGIGPHGSWYCSDILLGRALPASDKNSKTHDAGFPFSFYSINSEDQPSAEGHTTRPKE